MFNSELENEKGKAYKCGGIPMFPDESLYNEMRKKLSDDELEQYKRKVEDYYSDLKIDLPWDVD